MKDHIKLPPLHYDELPESDDLIPAMHNYARKAVKADRQQRGEPVHSRLAYGIGYRRIPSYRRHAQGEGGIMTNEQERAEFEEWALTRWPGATLTPYQNNCGITILERYKHPKLQAAWEAWQAGRAAMLSQDWEDALRKAIDSLVDFASTVAPSASFWDEVWPELEEAIAKALGETK